MKTIQNLAFLFALSFLITSCGNDHVHSSGDIVRETQNVSDFSRIDISDAFNAFVTFSDTEEKVEIEADDNLLDLIIVEKEGDLLSIRTKNFTSIKGDPTLNVHITTKSLTNFKASGDSHIMLENTLNEKDVTITISGASDFTGDLIVDNLTAKASGASHLNLSGAVGFMDLKNSGASQTNHYSCVVEDLNINLGGASSAKLTVNGKIDARLSGASNFKYKGTGYVENETLTGASEIKKID